MTKRRRDVTGRKHPRRNLVQQWLKQMVIAPIDERHVDLHVPEQPRRGQAAEPTADNDNAVPSSRTHVCHVAKVPPGRRLRTLL
jgi:hypothetical protein